MVIGIDADVHRVAYAAVNSGKLKAVGTIERADYREITGQSVRSMEQRELGDAT